MTPLLEIKETLTFLAELTPAIQKFMQKKSLSPVSSHWDYFSFMLAFK